MMVHECSRELHNLSAEYVVLCCTFLHVRPSSPKVIVSCCWKLLNPETLVVCSLKRLEDPAPRSTLPREEGVPRRLIFTVASYNLLRCTLLSKKIHQFQISSWGFDSLGFATIKRGASCHTFNIDDKHHGQQLRGTLKHGIMITPCAAPGCEEPASQRCSICK